MFCWYISIIKYIYNIIYKIIDNGIVVGWGRSYYGSLGVR